MAARPIDYSKWKDIEISDDEDDTHPNIDTPSLFKWRHEARLKRMEEFMAKKQEMETEGKTKERQLQEMRAKVTGVKAGDPNLDSLKKSLADLEKENDQIQQKVAEVKKEEKLQPWNVDTISKEGFSKTVVNVKPKRDEKQMTEEEKESFMKEFVRKHEKEIKHYGWLNKFDDSKAYLQDHNYLACEETANYLVIQCINMAMEEKFGAMEQVAHQCIAMQYLLELSKQLDVDPRACISSFFTKIQLADPEYKKAFEDELIAFKERIRRRAKEKIEEQMEELRKEEEQERLARLGPGGLDPAEVFETLPQTLQDCFQSQDIAKLQQVIKELPEEDARYHMKRCVDAGLWKPASDDPHTNPEDGFRRREVGEDGEEGEEGEGEVVEEGGENVYEQIAKGGPSDS